MASDVIDNIFYKMVLHRFKYTCWYMFIKLWGTHSPKLAWPRFVLIRAINEYWEYSIIFFHLCNYTHRT